MGTILVNDIHSQLNDTVVSDVIPSQKLKAKRRLPDQAEGISPHASGPAVSCGRLRQTTEGANEWVS